MQSSLILLKLIGVKAGKYQKYKKKAMLSELLSTKHGHFVMFR